MKYRFEIFSAATLIAVLVIIKTFWSFGFFSPSLASTFEKSWILSVRSEPGVKAIINQDCIQVPGTLPDKLSWTIFILKENSKDPAHQEKLQQLNALVDVGFLYAPEGKMIKVKNRKDDSIKEIEGYHYQITSLGKSHNINRKESCFAYGTPKFITVTTQKTLPIENRSYLQERTGITNISKIVSATATIGYKSTKEFYTWAQNEEIIRLFKLNDSLTKNINETFFRINGEWIPTNYAQSPHALSEWLRGIDQLKNMQRQVVYFNDIETKSFIHADRVLLALKKEIGRFESDYYSRVDLPGDPDFPADFNSNHNSCKEPYKIGIFLDGDKHPQRNEVIKTLPFLRELVARGMLTEREDDAIGYQKRRGIVFESTAEFIPVFSRCGNIGTPSGYTLLRVSYDNRNLTDIYSAVAWHYDRPSWVTDEILDKWIELRMALKYGRYERGWAFDFPIEIQKAYIYE